MIMIVCVLIGDIAPSSKKNRWLKTTLKTHINLSRDYAATGHRVQGLGFVSTRRRNVALVSRETKEAKICTTHLQTNTSPKGKI